MESDKTRKEKRAENDFIVTLFDFTFSKFIIVQVVRAIYILGLIISTIMLLVIIGIAIDPRTEAYMLLAAFFYFLGYIFFIIVLRACCEMGIVLYRIAENSAESAKYQRLLYEKSVDSPAESNDELTN